MDIYTEKKKKYIYIASTQLDISDMIGKAHFFMFRFTSKNNIIELFKVMSINIFIAMEKNGEK